MELTRFFGLDECQAIQVNAYLQEVLQNPEINVRIWRHISAECAGAIAAILSILRGFDYVYSLDYSSFRAKHLKNVPHALGINKPPHKPQPYDLILNSRFSFLTQLDLSMVEVMAESTFLFI